jgi:predicted TPR repeat methyltransferase
MHHDRFENALTHYTDLLKRSPQNPEYLYNAGVAQMALGHLQEARQNFETLLTLHPHHFAALSNLAAIFIRLGQREFAIQLLQRALDINPQDSTTQFMLHALTGSEKHAAESPEYVINLFNQYALHYDHHLQKTLQYSLPHHITRVLHQLSAHHLQHVLDLGCGTGLTGIVLREFSQHLTGVDLAQKMLSQAREKCIYDELVESEIRTFLANDAQEYALIVAADVLPYLGALEILFEHIAPRLTSAGMFLFTTEISQEARWQLQPNARFAHHPTYLHELCTHHDLVLIHQEQVIARHQDHHPVQTMLYAALKG